MFSTLYYPDGVTAQLSVNWSDESQRKMTTKITIWGTPGPDLRRPAGDARSTCATRRTLPDGYRPGWNVRYTTELTEPVWFYLRGEEYSAQLDDFVQASRQPGSSTGSTSFASAAVTDRSIDAGDDASGGAARARRRALTPGDDDRAVRRPAAWSRGDVRLRLRDSAER